MAAGMVLSRLAPSHARVLRRWLLVTSAVVVLVVATCAPAFAADRTPPAVEPATAAYPYAGLHARSGQTRWYGWQPLVADGASILIVPYVGSQQAASGENFAYLAVSGYLLGGPIIHLVHGKPGEAATSFVVRVGMPFAGALLAVAASPRSCHGDFCGLGAANLGGGLGVLGAIALDAAALSYERADDDDDAFDARGSVPRRVARQPVSTASSLAPSLGPRAEGGFDLGLGGTF